MRISKVSPFTSVSPPNYSNRGDFEVNFRCPHCGSTEIPASLRRDMSLETFGKVAPFFKYMDSVRLFDYGEPLLNPNFLEMIKLVKARKAKVGFHTNGMLLSDEINTKLVELGTDSVILSIDAATPETYNKIRPDGDFNRVVHNFKRLSKIKLGKNLKARA